MSETTSAEVDFFLPGAFFGARDKRASSDSLPSFLPSFLFSFSFSRFFSESLSFSLGAGSWGADKLFSLPPFPAPRPVSWALEGKRGKSGEEEDDVVDKGGGFPVAALLLSGVPCEARPRGPVEKVLKEAGVKALVARGLPETPGKLLGLLPETELVSTGISDEPFPTDIWPPIWLLRLVIEWEGDRGWLRSVPAVRRLLRREVLLELEDVWCGEREPGVLPEDDCRVTDSNIREWASLGVKRGARSNGLRFWRGASKRDEDGCWWWVWECRGANRRVPVPAPLPGAGNATGAAPPAPLTLWGNSPTSSAVRGGGRKLSNMGLRMRPSLAYLAEEKYCCLGWDREVQRKVGSLKIERLRLSDKLDSTDGPDRNGGMG